MGEQRLLFDATPNSCGAEILSRLPQERRAELIRVLAERRDGGFVRRKGAGKRTALSSERITKKHRSRLAVVYVRQSTQRQVVEHTESQRRQRELSVRATTLGWPMERIVTIDEDLGESGSCSGDRPGFERPLVETALGRVGLILAREPSRLARANSDWRHLLDVCAVTRTLLTDEQAVYGPWTMNDRLLLGIKGTMSEAELFVLKERMVKAILARAKRGEHRYRLPPGHVWERLRSGITIPGETRGDGPHSLVRSAG